ncbi:hypothetical protein ABZW18_00620 [Streptomyces sp. NPDC004647]|uniref:hypothetical protein n=1 Tax=Streptomyces sp. NPDC004647 TaxID=3154671 RepID=UPI0033B0A88E
MTPAVPLPRSLFDLAAATSGDLVADDPQSAYALLRDADPGLFTSPPGGGAIEILRLPMTPGDVVYMDANRMLVKDTVRLPDGRLGKCTRLLSTSRESRTVVLPVIGTDVVQAATTHACARDSGSGADSGSAVTVEKSENSS